MTNTVRIGQIWMSGSKRWYVIDRAENDQFVLAVTVNDEWAESAVVNAEYLLESEAITLSHYSTKDMLLLGLLKEKANLPVERTNLVRRFARQVEDIFYYGGMTGEQRARLKDVFDAFAITPRPSRWTT